MLWWSCVKRWKTASVLYIWKLYHALLKTEALYFWFLPFFYGLWGLQSCLHITVPQQDHPLLPCSGHPQHSGSMVLHIHILKHEVMKTFGLLPCNHGAPQWAGSCGPPSNHKHLMWSSEKAAIGHSYCFTLSFEKCGRTKANATRRQLALYHFKLSERIWDTWACSESTFLDKMKTLDCVISKPALCSKELKVWYWLGWKLQETCYFY